MRETFAAVRAACGDVNDAMRRYLADIESLDNAVGRLLRRLAELDLRDNTLATFRSDQGADMTKAGLCGQRLNKMGFNCSHRDGKHTNFESGLRVPWIMRWPGTVPANCVDQQSDNSGLDCLPWLSALTGIAIDASNFNGEDVSSAWLGKAVHTRSKPLLGKTSSPGSQAVIRDRKWKLFHPIRKSAGQHELYDIETHPMEARNLAAIEPHVA